MTTAIAQDLPDYEKPPVVEVVCGVLFKPIEELFAPHLGLLWEKFKADYPTCQEVTPLTPAIELFQESPEPQFAISNVPPLPRIWFVHASGNGIIQIQRDRFLHNWKKVRPDDEYPRYGRVISMFRDRFSRFEEFLTETQLGEVIPLQYEMTYVNHIPRGSGWDNDEDVGKIFPDFCWRNEEGRFLPPFESIDWRSSFALPERLGRLHATIRRVVRREDGCPLFRFELTARGIGEERSAEGMWKWFDLAREWIVRGFTDLTGKEIQERTWGRKR